MEVQSEISKEQSPLNRGHGRAAPQKEVAKPKSTSKGEPVEAPSFTFEGNKEGALPVSLPVEQAKPQTIEEAIAVERPPAEIFKENTSI